MEIYRTEDTRVTKYVHDDGSETAIKLVGSCDNQVGLSKEARNKYTVFVSVSTGCKMACKFCYLTTKKCPYSPLTSEQINSNVKEALDDMIAFNPSLKYKYIKLSWMGMGDALTEGSIVLKSTVKLLDYVFHKGYAKGLDGVDLATVYPKGKIELVYFEILAEVLNKYKFNTHHDDGRSKFRIFYSLHSVSTRTRRDLMPGSANSIDALFHLNLLKQLHDIDIIYHYMFLDGVNDSYKDEQALVEFMSSAYNKDKELRILRFNECPNSHYKESPNFRKIVDLLASKVYKLKYQVSTGSEIKAACGQFLLKRLEVT